MCHTSAESLWTFFFGEATVTGTSYRDAQELWLFPQLEEDEPQNIIWQQYGALPHWHNLVRDWLNVTLLDPLD